MKENVIIRKVVLESLDVRYFREKYTEQLKNMYPKLLATDIAPQMIARGKQEIKNADRTEAFLL